MDGHAFSPMQLDPEFCVKCGCRKDHRLHEYQGDGTQAIRQKTFEEFKIKDSGERKQFTSGMVRDVETGKVDFDRALDGPMFERWAAHLTKAVPKYADIKPGVPNWTLADDEEALVRFRKSAIRHFLQWRRGDTDEDHAAAVFFNINGYEYVKERLKSKRNPIPCAAFGHHLQDKNGYCVECNKAAGWVAIPQGLPPGVAAGVADVFAQDAKALECPIMGHNTYDKNGLCTTCKRGWK